MAGAAVTPGQLRRTAAALRLLAEIAEEVAGGDAPEVPRRPAPAPRRRRRVVPPPSDELVSDLDREFARRILRRG